MKQVSTTVNTGDIVPWGEGREARIGLYSRGKIAVHVKLNATSGYTEQLSTRELNKRLKAYKNPNP